MEQIKELSMADSLMLASKINVIKAILFGCQDETVRKSLMNQAEMFMRDFPATTPESVHEIAKLMKDQAGWQDTMLIFNPGYNVGKTDVIAEQAKTLEYLAKFIEGLIKSHKLKTEAIENEIGLNEIRKKFL